MSAKLHFNTKFSFEKSVHIASDLLANLVGGEHALRLAFERRDWVALAGFSPAIASFDVSDSARLRAEFQASALFKKNASLPLKVNRKAAALTKFLESESQCERTNRFFRDRSRPHTSGGLDAGLIFEVQRKIAALLGPFPGIEKLSFSFGPGANVGLSRFTSIRRKLSARPTVTAGAFKYVKYLRECSPHWEALTTDLVVVPGGKYASVPKNALTDRSILVEPLINSYLQTGVGSYIKGRLLAAGIDLSDQSLNQKLAYEGSVTGEWATIDLASASDTVSREVVKELLPLDWWFFLEDLRSQYAKLPDGKEIYLQKFSSMGNGFTFELETLIFFAIASVICKKDRVQVYGDDIIVKSKYFERMTYALDHFGFTLNEEKSFSSGLFRESCGRDYFGGVQVRPCYVKDRLSVKELFRLHNFFVREYDYDLAACLLKYIPKRFLVFGPDGYGDGHLLGDHDRIRPPKQRSRGYGGYIFRTYQTRPRSLKEELRGDHAAFLYLATQQVDKFKEEDSSFVPSHMMYQERGSQKYVMRKVYTLG